ncbi:MAG: translation initiation factor IF-3 [Candidatus Omnitrophica bacterium]|nr:translation initiation factor IF-3 [Candidatus Omnitrophota bacterium]
MTKAYNSGNFHRKDNRVVRTHVNRQIRAERIRLIDADGSQIGIVPLEEGLRIAEQRGLDLVEIAPDTSPPVCRILDFNKFKYQQEKRAKEAKKKQKQVHIKEARFKPRIEEHDYQVMLKRILRFLERGDRVRVRLFFRGREMAHPELGDNLMKRILADLDAVASVEKPPVREGRYITAILFSKH